MIQRRSITGGNKKHKISASGDRSNSVGKGEMVGGNNCSTSINSSKINRKYQNFTEELVHMLNLKINKKKAKCKN